MAEREEKSQTFAAAAFAGFTVVCLAAFLAYRGSDIGKMPTFFGNLGGGPLLGFEGLRDSIAGLIAAALIGISWYGLGSFVTSFIRFSREQEHSHILELATKTAVGAACWSLIWFFFGLAGAYSAAAAIASATIGLVLAAVSVMRGREAEYEGHLPEKASGLNKALYVMISIPVGLALVASLAPPTAKDTLLYHFSVPKAFIEQGSNAFVEGNIASYLALGTEMHTVWAMLLGEISGERVAGAAAGATVWLFFPILLAAIFGFAREIGIERRWSLIAVLMVAAVPTVYHVAASAYIDLALALFVTLAIFALTRWWKTLENASLVLIAIFLGAALSAKLTTLFVIAAFALVILLRVRKAQVSEPDKLGKIAGLGFGALVLAGVIASPWHLRTWKETGSPVFPFYMSIWRGEATGWDVERSNLFQAMNTQYGGYAKTALDYLALPWNISVNAQPEIATHFDGVLGVTFLIGLPILIWALWKFEMPVEVKIGTGVAGIIFLFWLFSSQQLRYLLPILPALAIGIVLAFQRAGEPMGTLRVIGRISMAAAAAVGIFVSTAWFLQRAPVRVVLGGEPREEYLSRNIDYYPYYGWLNESSPADAKVWLINMRRDTYHLDRPYFSDYLFEDWTLRNMVWEARSVEELRAKTAAMGVQYVLARHDFLFDYDRTTLVDEKRRRTENEAKIKIAREFILDPLRTIKADNKFSLVKVF